MENGCLRCAEPGEGLTSPWSAGQQCKHARGEAWPRPVKVQPGETDSSCRRRSAIDRALLTCRVHTCTLQVYKPVSIGGWYTDSGGFKGGGGGGAAAPCLLILFWISPFKLPFPALKTYSSLCAFAINDDDADTLSLPFQNFWIRHSLQAYSAPTLGENRGPFPTRVVNGFNFMGRNQTWWTEAESAAWLPGTCQVGRLVRRVGGSPRQMYMEEGSETKEGAQGPLAIEKEGSTCINHLQGPVYS